MQHKGQAGTTPVRFVAVTADSYVIWDHGGGADDGHRPYQLAGSIFRDGEGWQLLVSGGNPVCCDSLPAAKNAYLKSRGLPTVPILRRVSQRMVTV